MKPTKLKIWLNNKENEGIFITQSLIADTCIPKINKVEICDYINGKRTNPQKETIDSILTALATIIGQKVTYEEIF